MQNTWKAKWLVYNKSDSATWPKESKEYLVCFGRDPNLCIAIYTQNQWQSRQQDGAVPNLNDTVTHWCELPSLPEIVTMTNA